MTKKKRVLRLEAKKQANEVRQNILKELKKYSCSSEISVKLKPTATLTRRERKTKGEKKQRISSKSSDTSSETDFGEQDDLDETKAYDQVMGTTRVMEKTEQTIKDASHTELPVNKGLPRKSDAYLRRPVIVQRELEIEKIRCNLPAMALEQDIVEAIVDHDVTLITGSTGCGKSTQVPQFLYEAGFGESNGNKSLIGITQPRRVAATFLAQRVAKELNNSQLCGYQIRHDSSMTGQCRLKFMTDGVLLRELQGDFLCSRYSVIIIDEAHERSINCDLLIGLLSRVVTLRRQRFNQGLGDLGPLRLVIMSATLTLSDFTENRHLFPVTPPVIDIPSRLYDVVNHFSRRTCTDYVEAVANKVVEIHRKLPPGSILAFVPGRRQVHAVISSVAKKIACPPHKHFEEDLHQSTDLLDEDSDLLHDESDDGTEGDWKDLNQQKNKSLTYETSLNDDHHEILSSACLEENDFHLDDEEDEDKKNNNKEETLPSPLFIPSVTQTAQPPAEIDLGMALGFDSGMGMGSLNPKRNEWKTTQWRGYGKGVGRMSSCRVHLVPLYALLPVMEQNKAFRVPEDNERIIIVATNVAETSLTFPNIRYVVDSGKEKRMNSCGSDTAYLFSVQWITKMSAQQRSGRAGRVGPGHCYRLYSSAVYTNFFRDSLVPDILKLPLASTLLFMASLGIPHLDRFPFPKPPSPVALRQAKELLLQLKAITSQPQNKTDSVSTIQTFSVTPLGKLMTRLPLSPRLSTCLISALSIARTTPCSMILFPLCCLVCSGWTVSNLVSLTGVQKISNQRSVGWSQCKSDAEVACWLISHYLQSSNKKKFIKENHVHEKQIIEATRLYQQLLKEAQSLCSIDGSLVENWRDHPPYPCASKWIHQLHDIFLLGFVDHVCVFHEMLGHIQRQTHTSGFIWKGTGLFSSKIKPDPLGYYHVSLSPNSVHYDQRPRPTLLAFCYALATETDQHETKLVLHHCFPVNPHSLAAHQSPLVQHSAILAFPPPMYSAKDDSVTAFQRATFLPLSYDLPASRVLLSHDSDLAYQVFCQAFLEGEVVPMLKLLHNSQESYLRHSPSWLTSLSQKPFVEKLKLSQPLPLPSTSTLPHELQRLLHSFKRKGCCSRQVLQTLWKDDETYLKKEYVALLKPTCPKKLYNKVINAWGNTLMQDNPTLV